MPCNTKCNTKMIQYLLPGGVPGRFFLIEIRSYVEEKHPEGCLYLPVLWLYRFRTDVVSLVLIFRFHFLRNAVEFFF